MHRSLRLPAAGVALLAAAVSLADSRPVHVIPPLHDKDALGESSDTSALVIVYGDGRTPHASPYEHSNALFGMAVYGGGVAGPGYRSAINQYGCQAFNDTNMIGAIAVLDRGYCPFTQKVFNAQSAGAIGVVIIDSDPICPDASLGRVGSPQCLDPSVCLGCPMGLERMPCQCMLRYMADDGAGSIINIPSFMMLQYDGRDLVNRMVPGVRGSTSPFISMQWDIPNAAGKAEFGLWTHSNDVYAYQFRVGFRPYLKYLDQKVAFTANYYIWDGKAIGCNGAFDCSTQCILNGTYCSADPDGNLDEGISGADIVEENLRQLCVWESASSSGSSFGMQWWDYADAFQANCNKVSEWSAACSYQQMRNLGINSDTVGKCADPNADGTTWNHRLQAQIDKRAEMKIVALPTAVVSDTILRGGVSPMSVMTAICATFGANNNPPPVCACIMLPVSQLDACVGGPVVSNSMPGWGVGIIIMVVFGVIGSVGAAVWYKRKAREEVEEMMDDYRALVDATAAGGAGEEGGAPSAPGAVHKPLPARRQRPAEPDSPFVARLKMLAASVLAPPPATSSTHMPVPTE